LILDPLSSPIITDAWFGKFIRKEA
jgi:hypothetical protein